MQQGNDAVRLFAQTFGPDSSPTPHQPCLSNPSTTDSEVGEIIDAVNLARRFLASSDACWSFDYSEIESESRSAQDMASHALSVLRSMPLSGFAAIMRKTSVYLLKHRSEPE